jgi:hypothetical protein
VFNLDPALREYATERQWEILTVWAETDSQVKAAEKLGVHKSLIHMAYAGVLKKAAAQGYAPDYDMTHIAPSGFSVRGVSTLYDGDGEVRAQWVKTNADKEAQESLFKVMCETLSEALPKAKPIKPPVASLDHLLAVYPVGDHHFGMYAWRDEAGDDYDLDIAENLLLSAVHSLSEAMPKASGALLVFLGDLAHYDSLEPVTPTNKNLLDSDGRFAKMIRVALRSVRLSITLALMKHETVRVIVQPGNHDLSTMVFMGECLAALYENEPRVSVDTSPAEHHYFAFGKNLIGVCHGHNAKLEQLPLIMASDRPQEWGASAYRYWYTGHIHKDRVLDVQGTRVESFRILPPKDAWAASKYRTSREMKAMVLHRDYGETARHTINPAMLEA